MKFLTLVSMPPLLALLLTLPALLIGCGQKTSAPKSATEVSSPSSPNPESPTPPKKEEEPPTGNMSQKPKLTWVDIFEGLFQPKCVACHHPSGQVPWVDLSTYKAFKANKQISTYDPLNPQSNRLIERVMETKHPMPPPILKRLTAEELEMLLTWYEAGAPES